MVDTLLELVLDKRELQGISESFAKEILDEFLAENPSVQEEYNKDPERFTKKSLFQKLRKEVRKQLREVYGVFFTRKYASKKEEYVNELITTNSEQARQDVLELHRSTQERLRAYPLFYQQIYDALDTPPETILDIGCGFNPFAYEYLPNNPDYYCADIACEDLKLISTYLKSKNVTHNTYCLDLSKKESYTQLPQTDVVFAFKVFDSLETLHRDITAYALTHLPAKTLVISFPTKSIGQKKTIQPRKWFEELITDKSVTTVTLENEQVYIITE